MTVDTSHYIPDFSIKMKGKAVETFSLGSNIDIVSVSLTESTNSADRLQISVRDRHPTLARFPNGEELRWMDSDQFKEGSDIEVEMGYVQYRPLTFIGEIFAIAMDYPTSGVPTLAVEAHSLYARLQRKRTSKPFVSKRDGDIVRQIAAIFDLTAEVDDTNPVHEIVPFPAGTTYARILEDRAARLNYEVGVKQRTLFFQKPRYLVSTSATLTLTWGETLLSFSPRLTTANMPTAVAQRSPQTARGGDKTQPLVSEVRAADLPSRLGSRSGPVIAQEIFGDNVLTLQEHNIASTEEGQSVVQAKLQAEALKFVEGNGATIGNPDLVSRQVIELKGLGQKFSGKYYVTSTTHTIDAGGYRTRFTAKRDGI
jgi:phage protein D